MLACKGGHHNIVVELLTARADVNARHKVSHTVCSVPYLLLNLAYMDKNLIKVNRLLCIILLNCYVRPFWE